MSTFTALRTSPAIGQVFEVDSLLRSLVGSPIFRVINITTSGTFILLHRSILQLLRLNPIRPNLWLNSIFGKKPNYVKYFIFFVAFVKRKIVLEEETRTRLITRSEGVRVPFIF